MSKPKLTVIAGCNGSGKSTFGKLMISPSITPFDLDKRKQERMKSFRFDSEFNDAFAQEETLEDFEKEVKSSIQNNSDFSYETNFNFNPFSKPELFKKSGYELILVYFILDSIQTAKERVAIRVENGGHFVSDIEIQNRYTEGFKNLNNYFKKFDSVQIFDTSVENGLPKQIVDIKYGQTQITASKIPDTLIEKTPDLVKFLYRKPAS